MRNNQRGFKAKKAVNEKAKKENDGEKKYNLWVYICSPFQQRILEIRWLRNQLPSRKMKNATGRAEMQKVVSAVNTLLLG